MSDLSAAQRTVHTTSQNILGQASGIIQQLQGAVASQAGGSSAASGIGHRSLFDTELFQANAHAAAPEPKRNDPTKYESSADSDFNHKRDIKGEDVRQGQPERHSAEYKEEANVDDPIAAPHESNHSEPADSKGVGKDARRDVDAPASDSTPLQQTQEAGEPIGTAEELLASAEALLAQIEEFVGLYPELSQQLQVVLAPIQQSLEQLTTQLSQLAPNTVIGAQQLGTQTANAFARLEQFAHLFNQQQRLTANAEGAQLLASELPEDFTAALKSLAKSSTDALVKVNQIAETFRGLVPVNTPNQNENIQQALNASVNQAANKQVTNTQTQVVSVDLQQVSADVRATANAETKQFSSLTPSQGGDQQASTGGNNQNAQQQALANAQIQQQAANSNVSNARGESSLGSSTSLSSSAPTPAQAAGGAGQTSVTLTKEAANFEQILKQSGKPSAGEQVQAQIKSMAKDGVSRFIVKLDPPQLGELELRMQVNKNAEVKLVVTVERQGTLELLQRDSRMLMQALQDAGLQADGGSLSFNLSGGNDSQGEGQQQGKNVYPIAEEQFDEQMLNVASEDYLLEINEEDGVNIHA